MVTGNVSLETEILEIKERLDQYNKEMAESKAELSLLERNKDEILAQLRNEGISSVGQLDERIASLEKEIQAEIGYIDEQLSSAESRIKV